MTLPATGSKAIPYNLDFTVDTEIDIDLSELTQNGFVEFVSGAWIDNSASATSFTITCDKTNQRIIIAAGKQAYIPLIISNPPKFVAQSAGGVVVPLIFYNVPQFPIIIG